MKYNFFNDGTSSAFLDIKLSADLLLFINQIFMEILFIKW